MALGQVQGGTIPTAINIWIIGTNFSLSEALARTGCPACGTRKMDGAGAGLHGRIAGARSAQIHQPRGVPAKILGRQGINPDHKCKFQLRGLGRAVCPQPTSFNIYTPKRSTRRRRDTPPYLIFNFPKQTQPAFEFVNRGCDERDNPAQPLPVIFFGDDFLEVE